MIANRQTGVSSASQSGKPLLQNEDLQLSRFSVNPANRILLKQILVDSNRLGRLIIGVVKHRQLPLIKLIGAIILGKQFEVLNRTDKLPLLRVNDPAKLKCLDVIGENIKYFLNVFECRDQICIGLLITAPFATGQVRENPGPKHQRVDIFPVKLDRSTRIRNRFLGFFRDNIQLRSQCMGQCVIRFQLDRSVKDSDRFSLNGLVELVPHSNQAGDDDEVLLHIL